MSSVPSAIFLLTWGCFFANVTWAYKVSNLPLNKSGPFAVNQSEAERNVSKMVADNLLGDMQDLEFLPDPAGIKDKGDGALGKNLEFLILKVAQLETMVVLQQKEIKEQAAELNKFRDHIGMASDSSAASMVQKSSKKEEVRATLKHVLKKHSRQLRLRNFKLEKVSEKPGDSKNSPQHAKQDSPAMLQTQNRWSDFVDTMESGGEGFVDTMEDGGDMFAGLAEDAIDFFKSLGRFDADCPHTFSPHFGRDGSKLVFGIGRQMCTVTILGNKHELFDLDIGSADIDLMDMFPKALRDIASGDFLSWLPEPIKDIATAPLSVIKLQLTFAKGLVSCVKTDSSGLMECLGSKIIEMVPPLNYLTKMGDILTEVIEVFAKVASTVVQKAMEKGPSLVQTAATAKFPDAGEPPLLHHKSTNLIIESHTRHAPASSFLHREFSAMQAKATRDDPDGAINYKLGSGADVHATPLFTQFSGKETDTSSCLAFAPKKRRGEGVSESDWQVRSQDDFLQLEPWAVPCDNAWMKENWSKWQGYSFYFGQQAIEKCVTVTFSMGMQPVVAFVGGLQFEILPKPLFELGTTVCWPNNQPGGVDLSVLRSEIKSAGVLLFSRTLRLSKRFGSNTDFSVHNVKSSYETWRSPAGIPEAEGESRAPMRSLGRLSLLQEASNTTSRQEKSEASSEEESLQWRTETEDLYLASVDYGANMSTSMDKTFEAYGEEAARRMAASSALDDFKLFRFKSPGLVNFQIEGLMSGNMLELGMEMTFGPYKSPLKKIPLVDMGAQFALILAGLPFVSARSKLTAVEALKDFSMKGMGKAQGLPVMPGSIVALYSPTTGRYVKMSGSKLEPSPAMKKWGIPDYWTSERFTVVDAGNGEIALHSAAQNRFMGTGDASPARNIDSLPTGWYAQRFTVKETGHNGEVTLYNRHHKKCLKMLASSVGSSSSCGTDSHFVIVPAERILTPGTMIALHSSTHNRFVRMSGEKLARSETKDAVDIPEDWTSERFTVVDAGGGQIALHNAVQSRFVGIASCPLQFVDQLPGDSEHEKFDVYPAGSGEITLYNRQTGKVLRMSTTAIDSSAVNPAHLPDSYTWERFRVVRLKPYLEPGSTVALRNKVHGRYVKMYEGIPGSKCDRSTFYGRTFCNKNFDGLIRRSAVQSESGIPDKWTWERFTVVDAGNGQVAFHNSKHNRYITMASGKMRVSMTAFAADAFPSHWRLCKFTVVPAGDGQFVFHNSFNNAMIRMSDEDVDVSGAMSPQNLPLTWTWERFQIVPAKPYAQPGTIVALHNALHNRFLTMTGTALSRSAQAGANDLPLSWQDALFTVVDAGYGQVAFHNSKHKRFLRMSGESMGASSNRAADDLPTSWTWERFSVVPVDRYRNLGEFYLHNTAHGRLIRMSDHNIDSSGETEPQAVHPTWTWERFRIVQVSTSTKAVQATFD